MHDELNQIDEMASDIVSLIRSKNLSLSLAALLHHKGYRKATEVAREIITEIDNALHNMAMEYHNAGHSEYYAVCEMVHHKVIRPIEKKYAEEGK